MKYTNRADLLEAAAMNWCIGSEDIFAEALEE